MGQEGLSPYPSWAAWRKGVGCATSSEGKGTDSELFRQARVIQAIHLPLGWPVLACC